MPSRKAPVRLLDVPAVPSAGIARRCATERIEKTRKRRSAGERTKRGEY